MASLAVAGSIAQRPRRGGHAWVFLNYLLGLRRLGHEVLFVDRLDPGMLADAPSAESAAGSPQARWLHEVMAGAGLAGDYVLLTPGEEDPAARARLLDRLRQTDLLIDVNGFLGDAELLAAPARTAFLDIDPAIQQMWVDLGLADHLFGGHDLHFTFGENIGKPACAVPTCGLRWLPTRPPVVLDEWPAAGAGTGFTSVASWRGPYGSIEYGGETFGLRVHEFRRFLGLPERIESEWAVALDVDEADRADVAALTRAGWNLLDPDEVAGEPRAYRSFIQGSAAEISISKNVYVRSACGWFSDRSACYLASGRPVLAQETGFSQALPTGEGLVSFEDLGGAVAGAGEIRANWGRHSRAARALACEYFDSDEVLGRMLDDAGL
jgi:hypothetical protein